MSKIFSNNKIFLFNLILSIFFILFTFFNKNLDSPSMLKFTNKEKEQLITKIGDNNLIFTNVLTLSFLLLKKDYKGIFLYIKTFIPIALVTSLTKSLTKRNRPNNFNNKSFPSGHSALSFIAFIFLFFRYGLKISLPFLFISLFIGYSRVSTSWHHISDVLAGFLISYIFCYIFKNPLYKKISINTLFTIIILILITVIFNLILYKFLHG